MNTTDQAANQTGSKAITMEDLHSFDADTVNLRMGGHVLSTKTVWSKEGWGHDARIYRFTEQPVPGFGPEARGHGECALVLTGEAETLFEDPGAAIAWAMTQI